MKDQTINMKNKTNSEAAPAIDGAFVSLLQIHRHGEALTDAAEAMRLVTAAVRATNRPGSFTIKMVVRPASKGKAGALVVEDEIKTTLPKSDKEGSIFFADDKNNLRREDPNQMKLQLRTVDGGEKTTVPARVSAVATV